MATLATRIEMQAGRPMAAEEIFAITRARESSLSRLLTVFITTGLVFMLLPGTFLGVWNLLDISSHRAANSVSAGWIQAHGHAQIFGWIGTFILGIGFYSIPKLRRSDPFALWTAWTCWALWTTGVSLRWLVGVYQLQWRTLLPTSAALEIVAFAIFFGSVSGHRPGNSGQRAMEPWVWVIIAASLGLLTTLLVNLGAAWFLAFYGQAPDLPHKFDQRFLVLETWGFLVPFVWGFSAKWLPIFLGLRRIRAGILFMAVAANTAGVLAALAGWTKPSTFLLLAGALGAVYALHLFEPSRRAPKTLGVHASFPVFVRVAYLWAIIAASLGIWAASTGDLQGVWGASRHALTVGFLATMVFSIGQRVLPAFSGMHLLFSRKLMFLALFLLTVGCLMRVSFEILAYREYSGWAWSWLSVSAITEMTAVTAFAINLVVTFARPYVPPEV